MVILRQVDEAYLQVVSASAPVSANRVLRHYSFYNRWYEVNCSLDASGQLSDESFTIDTSDSVLYPGRIYILVDEQCTQGRSSSLASFDLLSSFC
jgi:hypothetical protein